jgi:hypothetical protein
MHRVLCFVVLSTAAAIAQGAAPTQDELLAAELAAPFLQKAPWLTDWDAALEQAKRQQRPIFAYFTTVDH